MAVFLHLRDDSDLFPDARLDQWHWDRNLPSRLHLQRGVLAVLGEHAATSAGKFCAVYEGKAAYQVLCGFLIHAVCSARSPDRPGCVPKSVSERKPAVREQSVSLGALSRPLRCDRSGILFVSPSL